MTHLNRLARKFAAPATLVVLGASSALATGTADADVAQGIENGMASWTLVKAALILVAVAVIGIRFLRRVR